MSLFKLLDLQEESNEDINLSKSLAQSKDLFSLSKEGAKLEEVFGALEQSRTHHFFTSGQWSTHDLLHYVLNQSGPAEVLIAVWSISESGARKLVELKELGLITNLQAVFDYRTNNRHPGALHLVAQVCDKYRTLPCHAKITLVKNDQWKICINGSPNYTNNPRPEAGYLCSIPEVYDFYKPHILSLLKNKNPYENE